MPRDSSLDATVRERQGLRSEAASEKQVTSIVAGANNSKWTFSLRTLFFWTTLIAVFAGLIKSVPALGIPMAILTLPAALRTIVAVARSERQGKRMDASERIYVFSNSIRITMGIVISVAAVFVPASAVSQLAYALAYSFSPAANQTIANATAAVSFILSTYFAFRVARSQWTQED
jgi:hypothetical protein